MNQVKESSMPWNYTKGMVMSHVALVTVLVKSGVITIEDVIAELDEYISVFSDNFPNSEELTGPIQLIKDVLLKDIYNKNEPKPHIDSWVVNFIGNA